MCVVGGVMCIGCNLTDITFLSIHFGLLPAVLANTAAIEAKEGQGMLAFCGKSIPVCLIQPHAVLFSPVSFCAFAFTSASVFVCQTGDRKSSFLHCHHVIG